MKFAFAFVAALAAGLTTAAAQNSSPQSQGTGSPTTTAPNTTTKMSTSSKKTTTNTAHSVQQGGQGRNSHSSPNKIRMAPTTGPNRGGATGSTNQETMSKNTSGKKSTQTKSTTTTKP